MNGIKSLKACKANLIRIKRLNAELEELRQPGCSLVAAEVLDAKEREWREARQGFVRAMGESIEAMAGMPEGPRGVLWRAYVLGLSNGQIAESMHYARRSVIRLKQSGFDWLEARSAGSGEGGRHEQLGEV